MVPAKLLPCLKGFKTMDLIKKLTGKKPDEYEKVAKSLVDNSDVNLFSKLVKQDDFLFDFVKNNVAKRIRNACNKDNYLNLLNFTEFYSVSYDDMFADVLYQYGGLELLPVIKEIFLNGTESQKAYAVKFFSLVPKEYIEDLIPLLRTSALSKFEPLAINSIEALSHLGDEVSKEEAFLKLKSDDEFEQYNAVKFLVTYQAKDAVDDIIEVMKKSTLSENIASEIPYLISIEELLKKDLDNGILVLSHIVNAIPEIISPSAVLDYNLYNIFEDLYLENLTSTSAILLRLAKDKFTELTSNEEYLFDCDKNTKDEVLAINNLLNGVNKQKLDSLLYEELYDGSDFVLFAVDFVDEIEELETLLDSTNPTLILKVLTLLKEKEALTDSHKELALNNVVNDGIKEVIKVL